MPGACRTSAARRCSSATPPLAPPLCATDPTLLLVIYDVAHAYVAAQGNDSFWAASCSGDYTQDAFNACRVPAAGSGVPGAAGGEPSEAPVDEGEGEGQEEEAVDVALYKLAFKVSCSQHLNDTVALEALATLESVGAFNQTVTVRCPCMRCSRFAAAGPLPTRCPGCFCAHERPRRRPPTNLLACFQLAACRTWSGGKSRCPGWASGEGSGRTPASPPALVSDPF